MRQRAERIERSFAHLYVIGILIGCGVLNMVYDKNVHWPFGRFKFQPELFLHGGEN
jgi:hypothetical protein